MVSNVIGDTVTERTYLSSVVLRWALKNFTQGAGDGPIMVGVAHSDYTSAEIEEWLENLSSWKEADLIGQEVAKRKIRMVGVFVTPATVNDAAVLNDGKPIRTKCGWILTQGQTLRVWAYNLGTSALATTVPDVRAEGHANLWPK